LDAVFGTSESAVRLLSALFGILSIPVIYVVGRQLFNKEVGTMAALILALSSFNLYYSQETRMYSLMVLLGLLSMYFFWRFLQHSSLVSCVGYVLSTTLLVWTHNFGWFAVIAENIYVIILLVQSKDHTFWLRRWAVLQAIVVALFAPWIVVLIGQISRHLAGSNLAAPTINDFIYTFSVYSGTPALLVLFLALSVLSLFGYQKVRGSTDWKTLKAREAYAWEVRIQAAAPILFLSLWLIAIDLIPFIVSRFSTPIYLDRYTIAASVALYLLVAKGISNINYRYAKIAVLGVIVILCVTNLQVYDTSVTKPQARDAVGFIDANLKSGDVILVSPDSHYAIFDYYNNKTDAVVKPLTFWAVTAATNSSATLSTNRPNDKVNEIGSDVNGRDRVWVFAANFTGGKPSENFTLSILNESYVNVYAKGYAKGGSYPTISTSYGYDVYLFEKRA
jgi:mannosyltransferase